jgi:hypothetical protein
LQEALQELMVVLRVVLVVEVVEPHLGLEVEEQEPLVRETTAV